MSITREQITAGLKKVGPCAPSVLADHIGAEASALGYHLKAMLEAKEIKATGVTSGRRIALPEQKFDEPASAPPQRRKKAKGGKRHKAAKPRRAKLAPKANGDFVASVTADTRLVINAGGAPFIYTEQQTEAIATLLFTHFED